MTTKKEDVRKILEQDEPDYVEAAKMGPEILAYLSVLVEDEDAGIASKAASLAGFIAKPESVQVLMKAAASQEPVVRVAAAGAARQLTDEAASEVLVLLVDDEDTGVQKTALKSLPKHASAELKEKVHTIAELPELPEIISDILLSLSEEVEADTEAGLHMPDLVPMPRPDAFKPEYEKSLSADYVVDESMDDRSVPSEVEEEMLSMDDPAMWGEPKGDD